MKFLIPFFILPLFLFAQPNNDTLFLQNIVSQLTADSILGRQTGSDGERVSALYLSDELKKIGVKPFYKDFHQPFVFDFVKKRKSNTQKVVIEGVNVIGYIDNQKDRTIVLGAHYDHLGVNEYGQARSFKDEKVYYPGADDNASGVALLLKLSKWLTKHKKDLNANYIIAFFSAEELGLQGSKHFVKTSKKPYIKPSVMLNFDMVGRLDDEQKLIVEGVGSAPSFDSLLTLTNHSFSFNLHQNKSGIGNSDYTSFYLDSIPALSFTTGSHSDYHTENDTKEKLNYQGILAIENFIVSFLSHLELSEIEFKETEVQQTRRRSDLKVSLGIMPGYGGDNGLQIDAVSKGKTAAIYGLKKDDLIIGIDDCNIESIYDYMDCLKKYDIGDQAYISILRNNEPLKIKVEFK